MSDISGITGTHKLTSQLKVSLESMQKKGALESTQSTQQVQQFEEKLRQVQQGLAMAQEIRNSLEAALRNLSG